MAAIPAQNTLTLPPRHPVAYTAEFVGTLQREADAASSMAAMHTMSHLKFNRLSTMISGPTILFSSIIGFSFMTPAELFGSQNLVLGALTILVTIMKTMDHFLDWTKRSEGHRLVAKSYARFSKFINIQLSLDIPCRISASDMLLLVSNDMQNLRDSEPMIPEDIQRQYQQQESRTVTVTTPATAMEVKVEEPHEVVTQVLSESSVTEQKPTGVTDPSRALTNSSQIPTLASRGRRPPLAPSQKRIIVI